MKIIKLTPQGFCGGVKYALNILDNALSDENVKKPIYLLGNIIHNHYVIDEYKNKGIITLNTKEKSRLELLNEINDGTVILSAHGTPKEIKKIALDKGLNVIDAVCPNVKLIHQKIEDKLKQGYKVIYIGTKKHPECEGVLGISNDIILASSLEDIDNLNITSNLLYVTNQTTLSKYDLANIFDKIINKYPFAIIDDKICNATTVRQEAVMNQEIVDLCIVVGDMASSNTTKLAKISQEKGIKTIFCESLKDLDINELKNINSISITSGASTPGYLVDEIIEHLNKM